MKHQRSRISVAGHSGYSLLELIVAMSLLAVVVTATAAVLTTARVAWESHEADLGRIRSAHALVRHIVRHVRDADAVIDVTTGGKADTRLRVRLAGGDELEWRHDADQQVVFFSQQSVSAAPSLLADQITGLEVTALRVDGRNYSGIGNDRIQGVTVAAQVTLPRETAVTREAIASVWMRTFGRSRTE